MTVVPIIVLAQLMFTVRVKVVVDYYELGRVPVTLME